MIYNKKVNRKYKDSLFTKLFSDEEKAIELYNAVEGCKYVSGVKIEINTLDDVLYLDRVNDISFIIEDRLIVLVEQQSSINQNMPLRFLLYISKLYERIIASDELNIYRRNLLKIPRPEFICLYNGKEDFPDEKILKLSDAFCDVDKMSRIDLDLSVKVININKGKNESIVQESKVLSDYVFFTDRIRNNLETGMQLEDAIDEAVIYCIENRILSDFLQKYRSEVTGMLATEFDLDKALKAIMLDGIEQGIEQKERDFAIELFKKGFSDSDIQDLLQISNAKLTEIKNLAHLIPNGSH